MLRLHTGIWCINCLLWASLLIVDVGEWNSNGLGSVDAFRQVQNHLRLASPKKLIKAVHAGALSHPWSCLERGVNCGDIAPLVNPTQQESLKKTLSHHSVNISHHSVNIRHENLHPFSVKCIRHAINNWKSTVLHLGCGAAVPGA